MKDRRIAQGLLIFLVSLSIILNMGFFFPALISRIGISRSLFFIFFFVLGALSIIVSIQYAHSRRFFLIFWNPVFAGIIASFALFLLVEEGIQLNMFTTLMLVFILYAVFIILYTHRSAQQEPAYEGRDIQANLALEKEKDS
ncbi:hypothetical protein HYZ97_02085 [Candidatus Pacearchaeota archaeon]|nr:hypothetical protein [Candidatus Pacearchaeota archaeon]